ncbi:Hypothetical protein FKW44_021711, partial [Caligus rogercresseyi]
MASFMAGGLLPSSSPDVNPLDFACLELIRGQDQKNLTPQCRSPVGHHHQEWDNMS